MNVRYVPSPKDDTDLLNGNLPRSEVEEGLQALMNMKG